MTQQWKLPEIAVKNSKIIYVPFSPAAFMCFNIETLVLIIIVPMEAGATISADITEKPRMGDGACEGSNGVVMRT